MYKSKVVAEGVRVVCVETNRYKTAELNITMALPLDDKAPANALALYLLKRSCKAYPDFTLLHGKLDELYGASLGAVTGKMGDNQILSLEFTCLDDKFSLDENSIIEDGIELLSGMLFNPNIKCRSFGKENLEAEKRLMIERVLDEQDDKRTYAVQSLIRNMCADEPFGRSRLGTPEEIENVTMGDVYSSWQNMISRSIIQITCVGSIAAEKVFAIFEKKFAKSERTPYTPKTVFIQKAEKSERIEERLPMNQGKLVIGCRAGMSSKREDIYAEKVMVDIFGGGTYSKLFTIIREKMSLCYYCSARLYAHKGLLLIDCGIDTENEKAACDGIKEQLGEVIKGNFDDEILASSKRSLRERHTFSTPDAILAWYDAQIFDEELLTPDFVADNIDKVTKEEVMKCAAKVSVDTIFMLAADEPEVTEGEN